jgi:hypothetical protein
MSTPPFQPPQYEPPQPGRRERSMYQSPEAMRRRIAYLDRIDRRCIANSGTCVINAATFEFTVRDVDPETREPTGEPYTVKTCTRHVVTVDKATGRYHVLDKRRLPPAQGQGPAPRNRSSRE